MTFSTADLHQRSQSAMAPFARTPYERPLSIDRGEGSWVWDAEGNRYLDFFGGVLTTMTGHDHPAVTRAIRDQAGKVLHTSTLYLSEPRIELAELIADRSGSGGSPPHPTACWGPCTRRSPTGGSSSSPTRSRRAGVAPAITSGAIRPTASSPTSSRSPRVVGNGAALAGLYANVIRMAPMLNVTAAEIDQGVDALTAAVADVA